MEKTKKIINDRLDFLNDWLEKTKDFKDESTVANRMAVNETLVYFIRIKELLDILGQNPTYEIALEVKELVSVTIDKLISHNQQALNGHAKLVESLNSKIQNNPEKSEKEKDVISQFEQAFSSIKQYLDDCIEAKNEINAIIQKIEAENEVENIAPIKYDVEELEKAIDEENKTEMSVEEIVEHIVDDVESTAETELLDDDEPKKDNDNAEFPI